MSQSSWRRWGARHPKCLYVFQVGRCVHGYKPGPSPPLELGPSAALSSPCSLSLLPCPTPGTPSPHPGPLPRWPSGVLCASPPGSWLLDGCTPASRLSLLSCSSSDSCVLPGVLPSPLLQFPGPAQLGSPLRPALGHCRLGACLPAMAGALGLLSIGGPGTELGEGRGEGRGSRNAEKGP